ncbi:ribosome-associated protein YbcJ [Arsenophonus nasoniae]|uniref:Ribosome-associated protein YbcJ n=1 Tax=Arsenophonus nasoniae TaxID=638 RepID=A0AA95GCI4_9GAMM|nr:ribosome-associated protein YbcJ [Arsenophonus nasoniae]WGL94543.1 ribosome-associated protein YbcJ [Arsenophonus nasoniae]WGM00951.1 ribosome-associated protein YbcJ [Arsenophonus nasoniae]
MEIFHLDGQPYIKLCDLLKLQGWVESGAAAKTLIAQGEVKVDGKVETRKRCKISKNNIVTLANDCVIVKE